jgi:hypothetical protein
MGDSNDPGFKNIPNQQVDKYLTNAAAHIPGINNESVIKYYDEWAGKYDSVILNSIRKVNILFYINI